jgi:UDP-N-acetylglucosamine acyltransferase
LYVSGLNTAAALQKIEAEMPATSERDEIILFIQNAKRGIMRGYGKDE